LPPDRADSPSLHSIPFSHACDPALPTAPAWGWRSPIPRPVVAETPRSLPPFRAARSNAWPRPPPESWHRCRSFYPSADPFPPTTPAPSGTPLDAFPHRSAAGCAKWSSDPAVARPVPPQENYAAPVNPPPATRSHARPQSPRSILSAANENIVPAPRRGAPSAPHRSAHIAAPQTRHNPPPPATGLAARRTDVL